MRFSGDLNVWKTKRISVICIGKCDNFIELSKRHKISHLILGLKTGDLTNFITLFLFLALILYLNSASTVDTFFAFSHEFLALCQRRLYIKNSANNL